MRTRFVLGPLLLCSVFLVFALLSAGSEGVHFARQLKQSETAVLSAISAQREGDGRITVVSTSRIRLAGLRTIGTDLPLPVTAAVAGEPAEEGEAMLSIAGWGGDPRETVFATLDWARGNEAYVLHPDTLRQAGTAEGDLLAIALGRFGYPDHNTAYLSALQTKVKAALAEGDFATAEGENWRRAALAILALGGDAASFCDDGSGGKLDLIAAATYQRTLEELFAAGDAAAAEALLLLDAAGTVVPAGGNWNREALIEGLLERQSPDGGFAAGGQDSVYATAAVLQALEPYRGRRYGAYAVDDSIASALAYLAQRQDGDGAFSEDGHPSVPATAEVVKALAALGVDADEPAGLVRNGHSPLEGLMGHYLGEEGAFSALPGGEADLAATNAAREALVAYDRFLHGESSYYDFGPEKDCGEAALRSLAADIEALPADYGPKAEPSLLAVAVAYQRLNGSDRGLLVNGWKLEHLLMQMAAAKWGGESGETLPLSDEAKALDAAIGEGIDPLQIGPDSKNLVENLYRRFLALGYGDKLALENGERLLLAYKILRGLEDNVVIAEVFRMIQGQDVEYRISGLIDGVYAYFITFNGLEVVEAADFDASVVFHSENASRIALRAKRPVYINFLQQGPFPCPAKVRIFTPLEPGNYRLYRYAADGDAFFSLGPVAVTKIGADFDVAEGGDYFLTSEEVKKNVWYLNLSDFPGGVIPAAIFAEIQGQDITVEIDGQTPEGLGYTVAFYGRDIQDPQDFSATVVYPAAAADAMRIWHPDPYVVHFAHGGTFPGKARVDLSGLTISDGEYRLFYFDAGNEQATLSQTAAVSAGAVGFSISQGGDYFLAPPEEESDPADDGVAAIGREAKEKEEGFGSPYFRWLVGGGLLLIAGIVGGFFWLRSWE